MPKSISSRLIIILIVTLLEIGVTATFVMQEFYRINQDAKAINNFGIIRGSIQRFTKYTLLNSPNIENENVIEDTFTWLKQKYISMRFNVPYMKKYDMQNQFLKLEEAWKRLNEMVNQPFLITRNASILEQSEVCWELANKCTESSQFIHEDKLKSFQHNFYLLLIMTLITLVWAIYLIKSIIGDKLEKDASIDQLTKAYNKNYFKRHYLDKWNNFEESQNALLIIDLDDFKVINDTYGHMKGDIVLYEFASVILRNIRINDKLIRFGGEEFIVILHDSNSEYVHTIANNLLKKIQDTIFAGTLTVTASIGLDTFGQSKPINEALNNADKLLYKAKKMGKNQVVSQ